MSTAAGNDAVYPSPRRFRDEVSIILASERQTALRTLLNLDDSMCRVDTDHVF
jgi:hypothetical protein